MEEHFEFSWIQNGFRDPEIPRATIDLDAKVLAEVVQANKRGLSGLADERTWKSAVRKQWSLGPAFPGAFSSS
jgi:hypothetical protein